MRRRRAGWHTVKNENWVVLKLILLNMIFDKFCVSAKYIFWPMSISWWRFIFCHRICPPDWYGRRIFHLLSLRQMGQMWLAPGIFGSTPGHFCWLWTSPCESHIFLTSTVLDITKRTFHIILIISILRSQHWSSEWRWYGKEARVRHRQADPQTQVQWHWTSRGGGWQLLLSLY